jgi:hypothetical protein
VGGTDKLSTICPALRLSGVARGAEINEGKTMIKVRQVAEICHETNRAYCNALGDDSQAAWANAPEWQRVSAINGVIFHRNNPEATPSASHESWLAEKRAAGWTYGPVKDAEKKQHPCFIPFTGLPLEQQAKDRLFKGIVDSLRELIEPAEPYASPAESPVQTPGYTAPQAS